MMEGGGVRGVGDVGENLQMGEGYGRVGMWAEWYCPGLWGQRLL